MTINARSQHPSQHYMETGPAVSVIVVNHNAGSHLLRCLESLERQSLARFEVLVMDCASTDGSFQAVQGRFGGDPRFRWRALGYNAGFAVANNLAAAEALGPWLALLNPDAEADPHWLQALMEGARRHPHAGLFGSVQWDAAQDGVLDGAGDCYHALGLAWRGGHGRRMAPPQGDDQTFGPCAAAMMVDRSRFLELGGFDPRFFCYCEDVDFAWRWRLGGGHSVQLAAAEIRHHGGVCSDPKGTFARYHGLRNAVWCFVKNMPGPLLAALLPFHLLLLLALMVRGAVKGHGGVTARALRDAVKGLPAVWGDRGRVQAARRISVFDAAHALCWSPGALLKRPIHLIDGRGEAPGPGPIRPRP